MAIKLILRNFAPVIKSNMAAPPVSVGVDLVREERWVKMPPSRKYVKHSQYCVIDPLTPVQPVTGCDEPWPFFHFWRHHFWSKLASSILNFCRRKRSFQWFPGQIDQPNGAWDMHKNAKKDEWKTSSKISCHYSWLLHGKNCLPRWHFLRSFLTANKLSRRSITAARTKEKEKKERGKKFKNRKA